MAFPTSMDYNLKEPWFSGGILWYVTMALPVLGPLVAFRISTFLDAHLQNHILLTGFIAVPFIHSFFFSLSLLTSLLLILSMEDSGCSHRFHLPTNIYNLHFYSHGFYLELIIRRLEEEEIHSLFVVIALLLLLCAKTMALDTNVHMLKFITHKVSNHFVFPVQFYTEMMIGGGNLIFLSMLSVSFICNAEEVCFCLSHRFVCLFCFVSAITATTLQFTKCLKLISKAGYIF